MPKRAQRLVFTASAPFSYALRADGGGDGLDGVNERLWRGSGGMRRRERHRGARERLWELVSRLVGQLVGQLVSQLVSHFSAFRRTQKAAFLTKRGCSLAVLRQKGAGVWGIEN